MENFIKYPRTPHLFDLGNSVTRDDKLVKDIDGFLDNWLTAEEKIDGANIGIQFIDNKIKIQSRGSYIDSFIGQWKKLPEWFNPRIPLLLDSMGDRYILFGEWCYAQHTVKYTKLPDWFIGFDIYDKQTNSFSMRTFRDVMFYEMRIYKAPVIASGRFTKEFLESQLDRKSQFGEDKIEGIYLRNKESTLRAKVVRPNFICGEHWSKRATKTNALRKNFVITKRKKE